MKPRILLIAPLFFDYYKDMIAELETMGYDVDYICDTHSNSNLTKALGRVCKGLIRGATGRYFKRTVRPLLAAHKYAYVITVAGMTFSISRKYVREMREAQPDACFVLYQWDSERNLPYVKDIQPYFDRIFSFDRSDCAARDIYRFLPLFYTRTYEALADRSVEEYLYDCSYIGTAHPKKYHDINCMVSALHDRMPRQMIHHYMPSRLKYWYHKLFAKEYKRAKYSDFRTEKMSAAEIQKLMEQSFCILDAPQKGQSGLTMRVIEALGAKRKLITTNREVVEYDFYTPENIYVFDGTFDFDHVFFHTPYRALPAEIYEKYSLRNWLSVMLTDGQQGE